MGGFFMRQVFTALALALCVLGCMASADEAKAPKSEQTPAKQSTDAKSAAISKVPVGKNVVLEVQRNKRRVVVEASVCLREGMLEEFLCRKYTKEHESILTADIDARDLHKALVLTGAEPGSPAQFEPTYKPATGPHIKVSVRYEKDGKTITVPAQDWIRDSVKKKAITVDWVFAGSKLVTDPLEPKNPPIYLANNGDIISVSNFDCSLLDIAIRSTDKNANLAYEAFTDRIPPLQTKVQVILEPADKPPKKLGSVGSDHILPRGAPKGSAVEDFSDLSPKGAVYDNPG
jgi:hypothetical protein